VQEAVPAPARRPAGAGFGGCRCQALRIAGDAYATDPVCRYSPHHNVVVAARDAAQSDDFTYRTMRRPARV